MFVLSFVVTRNTDRRKSIALHVPATSSAVAVAAASPHATP